eukprot:scaffold195097_cov31-Tisochrysis_lutea.AAC.1
MRQGLADPGPKAIGLPYENERCEVCGLWCVWVAVKESSVHVLQHGCLHGGPCLAVRGVWGSGAHLAGRVFLARSLRRQRRVHQYFVHHGEGGGSGRGERRALHDPISLLILGDLL